MLRHASPLSTPLRCRAEPPDEGCGARTMPNDENVDKNWEGFSEVRVDTRTARVARPLENCFVIIVSPRGSSQRNRVEPP